MRIVKTLPGQELAALLDDDLLFEAADLNEAGITDAVAPGTVLRLPAPVPNQDLSRETVTPRPKPEVVAVLYGQTWVDLALQQLGDEERLFELTDLNGRGITDEIAAGTVIASPDAERSRKSIVNLLKVRRPASGRTLAPDGTESSAGEGIEFWGIEIDFVVS